jgi:hypothetical protein
VSFCQSYIDRVSLAPTGRIERFTATGPHQARGPTSQRTLMDLSAGNRERERRRGCFRRRPRAFLAATATACNVFCPRPSQRYLALTGLRIISNSSQSHGRSNELQSAICESTSENTDASLGSLTKVCRGLSLTVAQRTLFATFQVPPFLKRHSRPGNIDQCRITPPPR